MVTGAAAEVARQAFPHLLLGRVRVLGQQAGRRHHHAGGAEAALQPVLGPERLLDRVQAASGGETLGRGHLRPAACTVSTVQDLTDIPFSRTVQAPQDVVSQPTFAARSPSCCRR